MAERDVNCPAMAACSLFPLFRLASNLEMWQDRYCRGGFGECARYKLSSKALPIPDDLLPNGQRLRKAQVGKR